MAPPPAKRARRAPGGNKAAASAAGAAGKGDDLRRALAWLESYPKVSSWMARYDVEALVDAAGGLAVVPDFLPPFVAEGALRIMERLPPGWWKPTEAAEDYTHNNIAHAFLSVKGGAGDANSSSGRGGGADEQLQALLRAFTLLLPDQLNAFSAARYERGHHIAPHDDRAYTPVMMDTGEVVTCSRVLTCVYYLTKDWTPDMGGALVDLEAPPEEGEASWQEPGGCEAAAGADGQPGARPPQHPAQRRRGRVLVPHFNTAVFFRVPHWHAVTPLTTDRPRFSVFGWFLQLGKLYELYTGEDAQLDYQAQQAQQGQQHGQQEPQPRQLPALDAARQHGGNADCASPRGKAAKGKRHKRQQRQRLPPGNPGDGVAEGAQHCKLAQRLLAKLAAGQQAGADG
ncbi:hypothetical protein ABPG77_010206 [Micractinium sp. CCAP 211/92]